MATKGEETWEEGAEGEWAEEAEGVVMEASIGVPRAQQGKWASCIRVVEPTTRQTLSLFELEDNEAAIEMTIEKRSPDTRHAPRTHRIDFDWLL